MFRVARLADGGAPEHAVRILRALPHAKQRMVFVVTHVAEVMRRISTRMLVVRAEVGRRIRLKRNA